MNIKTLSILLIGFALLVGCASPAAEATRHRLCLFS